MYILCHSGYAASANMQQQGPDWAKVGEQLRKGEVSDALKTAEGALSWLQQDLQRAMDDSTTTSLGEGCPQMAQHFACLLACSHVANILHSSAACLGSDRPSM
jgi:hypothetical protein